MKRTSVVLLSGGLDSTTTLAHAKHTGWHPTALSFDYGQAHRVELDRAQQIAAHLQVPHEVIHTEFFGSQAGWFSSLLGEGEIPTLIEGDSPPEPTPQNIPSTYVPQRNLFMATIAAAYLESKLLFYLQEGLKPTDIEAAIFLGINAVDWSGYPDCTPLFRQTLEDAINEGSRYHAMTGRPIRVEAPLLTLSKKSIIHNAISLHAPIHLSWSCYRGGTVPCQDCPSCIIRARAFHEANIPDPALCDE